MENSVHKSTLALAIEQRERPLHEFEVQGFFGLGERPIHKIAIRVNTKSEQDKSIIVAHLRVTNETKGAESARNDQDLLLDAKTIEVLYRACRDASDPKYPAFPGSEWMRDNLTTDQLAALLNLYHECVKRDGPTPSKIDFDMIESMAMSCADHSDSDIPEALLAHCPREWLTQAFVLLSIRYMEAKKKGCEDATCEPGFAEHDSRTPIDDGEAEIEQPAIEDAGHREGSGQQGT